MRTEVTLFGGNIVLNKYEKRLRLITKHDDRAYEYLDAFDVYKILDYQIDLYDNTPMEKHTTVGYYNEVLGLALLALLIITPAISSSILNMEAGRFGCLLATECKYPFMPLIFKNKKMTNRKDAFGVQKSDKVKWTVLPITKPIYCILRTYYEVRQNFITSGNELFFADHKGNPLQYKQARSITLESMKKFARATNTDSSLISIAYNKVFHTFQYSCNMRLNNVEAWESFTTTESTSYVDLKNVFVDAVRLRIAASRKFVLTTQNKLCLGIIHMANSCDVTTSQLAHEAFDSAFNRQAD